MPRMAVHVQGDRRNEARSSSVSAYNDINRTLGNFYESPQEDPEKEALKAEVEQLKQAVAAQNAQPGYEEQVALLEKSYELAAKVHAGQWRQIRTAVRMMESRTGWKHESRSRRAGFHTGGIIVAATGPGFRVINGKDIGGKIPYPDWSQG